MAFTPLNVPFSWVAFDAEEAKKENRRRCVG